MDFSQNASLWFAMRLIFFRSFMATFYHSKLLICCKEFCSIFNFMRFVHFDEFKIDERKKRNGFSDSDRTHR